MIPWNASDEQLKESIPLFLRQLKVPHSVGASSCASMHAVAQLARVRTQEGVIVIIT